MSAGSARLTFTQKALRECWDDVKQQWSDQVSRDFEKNHLLPLDHQTSSAIRAMDKIAEVLHKIRQDCS
ncbi:hypothetical protein [Singulisphaera acidiphila]|uniref:Uncharacterized protein n=1 Tax=Singulisphaera acidiphila (strain ATCC BAA-1392 / DSM 18658 / VKM B-2454 / MOB10) TaxID=886293 RepID=L0DLX5_SINAD|nr:hypothetical protein [Singulisphaera acidiphila]AGA30369.1 hypothetical protein Sinac_6282 [Singulisphaera acidiphila DSM 18658]